MSKRDKNKSKIRFSIPDPSASFFNRMNRLIQSHERDENPRASLDRSVVSLPFRRDEAAALLQVKEQRGNNIGSVWSKEFIQQLANTHEWRLSSDQCQSYLQFLYASEIFEDDDAAAVLTNYHHDHPIVQALLDGKHPSHSSQWHQIERFVAHILNTLRKTPIMDRAVEDRDLRQVVLANIVRGLPAFRYRSRLTTWIHNIAQNTAHQEHRYRTAQRRAAVMVPIDDYENLHEDYAQHDALLAAELSAEIHRILSASDDPRLLTIFQLKIIEGQRLKEIGELLHLSPARISGLLKVIRNRLQDTPGLGKLETG